MLTPVNTEKTRAPLIFQSHVKAEPRIVFDAFFAEPNRWLCREASIDLTVGTPPGAVVVGDDASGPPGAVEGRGAFVSLFHGHMVSASR